MEKLRSSGIRRLLVLAGLSLLVGLVAASSARAMDTRSGDRVVIGPDEVVDDDVYVAANEVVVDGTINGDLIAIGNRIEVNGQVEQDVMAAGQSVQIGGTVGHAARIAGQTLLLNKDARVAGDLVAAGFSLQNEPDSIVRGSLAYAGSQALLEGTVDEDLTGFMNGLELGGDVGRNVDVQVDGEGGGPPSFAFAPVSQVATPTVAPGLTLTDNARVGGDLNYESSTEAQISPDAQIGGEVARTERPPQEEPAGAESNVGLNILRNFITLLVVGLLLVWVMPNWIRRRAYTVLDRPLASLGWGVLGFLAFVALAIVILLVTILLAAIFGLLTLGSLLLLIIGLGLLAELGLGLAFWISTSYLAQIIASFVVGTIVVEAVRAGRGRGGGVLALVVGLIVYVLLRAIPILGFIVGLAVVLLGLGAISNWVWRRLRRAPTQPPSPTTSSS